MALPFCLCFTSPCSSGILLVQFACTSPLPHHIFPVPVCECLCCAHHVAPIKPVCSCLHAVQSLAVSHPLPFRSSDLALSPHSPEHPLPWLSPILPTPLPAVFRDEAQSSQVTDPKSHSRMEFRTRSPDTQTGSNTPYSFFCSGPPDQPG